MFSVRVLVSMKVSVSVSGLSLQCEAFHISVYSVHISRHTLNTECIIEPHLLPVNTFDHTRPTDPVPAVTALQPVALRRNVVRVALLASPTTRKVRRTSPPPPPRRAALT